MVLHPNHVLYYSSFLFSLWDILPDPSGWLKLQILPNSIHDMVLIYTYTPMRKSKCFSLAYPNCQHHYFHTSGPLVSKIRITWTQALWYHESESGNWEGHQLTNGQTVYPAWARWIKGWFTSWAGGSMLGRDLITRLRIVNNVNLWIVFFRNISFIFRSWLTTGNWIHWKQNQG